MTLFYKLSSRYKRLSTFILWLLISVKNVLVADRLSVFMTQIWVKLLCKVIFNNNAITNTHTSTRKDKQGFTLVELMVTIAVLAIIVMIAAPAIFTQLAQMEAKRIRYEIMNTLAVAKAESYIRRQNLLVCLSDTGGQCDKNAHKKLLLFLDKNDNKNFDVGIDDLLAEQSLNPKYGTLHLRAGGRDYVRFAGDSGNPRGFFGHIKYCSSSTYAQAMYQVSFNQNGIIRYKPNDSHPTGCGE